MKIKDTGELIGGYNKLYWCRKNTFFNFMNRGPIFRIDKQKKNLRIVNKVSIPYYFVKSENSNPKMHNYFQLNVSLHYENNSYAIFDGLYLKDSYCHFNNNEYINFFKLKRNSVSQLLEEYEVYQIN